jgi:diacylglycerol kinase family enzyme
MPAFINPASGSADSSRAVLAANPAFRVREVAPAQLFDAVRAAVAQGAPRILVAGGDGTIGTAASAILGGDTELAILPAGTRNHFAGDLGICDEQEAMRAAVHATSRRVDVGTVNDRVFVNTSSVGAYVHFVRIREYLEGRFGYRLASAIAAFRILFEFRRLRVEIDVDGRRRTYLTPLVFIGVGERELQLPILGNRAPAGQRGLHVLIVRGRTRARTMVVALNAVARGVKTASQSPELDSFIVDRCVISRSRHGTVALDGELATLHNPLVFELRRDALRVVCP